MSALPAGRAQGTLTASLSQNIDQGTQPVGSDPLQQSLGHRHVLQADATLPRGLPVLSRRGCRDGSSLFLLLGLRQPLLLRLLAEFAQAVVDVADGHRKPERVLDELLDVYGLGVLAQLFQRLPDGVHLGGLGVARSVAVDLGLCHRNLPVWKEPPAPQPYPSLRGGPREGDLPRPDGAVRERHILPRRQGKGIATLPAQPTSEDSLSWECPAVRPPLPCRLQGPVPITGCPLARRSSPRRPPRTARRTTARGSWPGPPWPARPGPACPCRTSGCGAGP